MSFRLKTILGIGLIESILLIVLIFSSMNFLSQSNESHLKLHAETTSILFSRAVKNAIISTDLATLESFTEDILTLPDILYARISNNDLILAEGGDTELIVPSNENVIMDNYYHISINIEQSGTTFGKIEIGLSTQAIQETLSDAQHWAIAIASLEVILVAIFSFILGTYLTNQLLELKTGAQRIIHSGPGHQIKVSGQDELADLANTFNSMSTSLAESYDQLSQSVAAERKMRATADHNQARNNAIVKASMDALVTVDQQGRVVDYNKVAEQTFGWKYDEIVGLNLADFVIPKNKRQAHFRGMKRFIITKSSPLINQRLELTALHKSGKSFPIEVNISPIETEQGMLFTAFIRDISARLQNETELRLAAQTFESSEAIFISDALGQIIRTNQAFTTITGYSEAEVLGQNPSILASGQHNAAYYKQMWDTLATQGKWAGEIYNKRKNGEIYPEHLIITALKDKHSTITHYIAHFMDISEQKNNEENLRQARIEADASNQSKSQFLASMSHEIRTPMNAVIGILDLLKETPLDAEQQPLIQSARDSGELLLNIINDILDFTKIDMGELILQRSEFDLRHALQKCIALMQFLATKKSLQLSLQTTGELPECVCADHDRLQQVLINLINNAIKFTDHGAITLSAEVMEYDDEQYQLRFQVSDTGIGIAAENQQHLFDEFTMVDQTHSRKYEGTGLGLAICHRLVALMGGEITVQSELGKGSTFMFTIKLRKGDKNNLHDQQATLPPIPIDNHLKLLVAEDNKPNQMVIKKMLQRAHLDVDVVNNGYEALQAVQKQHYDIVLMDISMPEMDGMSATQAIRKLAGEYSDLPIVALTAHTLSGDRERFLAAGMNDYLSKPIVRQEALHCIARWTSKTAPIATPSTAMAPKEDLLPYVDEKVLTQLVLDTDAEVVPDLITLYVEDSKQRAAQLQAALDNHDINALEFEAHTLGSSAIAHGNARLHQLARKIEHLCREKQTQQAFQEAQHFSDVAEASFTALTARAQQGFQ